MSPIFSQDVASAMLLDSTIDMASRYIEKRKSKKKKKKKKKKNSKNNFQRKRKKKRKVYLALLRIR